MRLLTAHSRADLALHRRAAPLVQTEGRTYECVILPSAMPAAMFGKSTSPSHARSTRPRRTSSEKDDVAHDSPEPRTHTCTIHVFYIRPSSPLLCFASSFLISHQGKATSQTLTHPSAPPLTTLPLPFPSVLPLALMSPSPTGSQDTTAPPIGAAPGTCTYRKNGG